MYVLIKMIQYKLLLCPVVESPWLKKNTHQYKIKLVKESLLQPKSEETKKTN